MRLNCAPIQFPANQQAAEAAIGPNATIFRLNAKIRLPITGNRVQRLMRD
ncbi:hypothetical protein [Acetobacter lambici]|nr:hypothetical protein [Acetobacter lambici]MCP1243418.1 hypothetical protein [Acetobacter lambici]